MVTAGTTSPNASGPAVTIQLIELPATSWQQLSTAAGAHGPREYDWAHQLEQYRAIATRCDKTATSYRGMRLR
ncbi:hypothetical protein [Nocardia sp. NPDC049707]|uniref:hypothetical protein n=1 Tax=Nocardia sp. NPDC049707 TaxID=3154735 RepID=UPI0034229AD1